MKILWQIYKHLSAIVHDILIAFLSFYIHLGYYTNMAVCIYTSTDLYQDFYKWINNETHHQCHRYKTRNRNRITSQWKTHTKMKQVITYTEETEETWTVYHFRRCMIGTTDLTFRIWSLVSLKNRLKCSAIFPTNTSKNISWQILPEWHKKVNLKILNKRLL